MAEPSSTAFTFAGYLLAKSFSILVGAPCEELLVPIALVAKSSEPDFLVFEAKSQAEAIQNAQNAMKDAEGTATDWAFVHEGFVRDGGVRTDAFFVRIWTKGQTEPTTIVQPWKKQAASCESATLTRIGSTRIFADGKLTELTDQQRAALERGINNSPKEIAAWKASAP